VDDAQRARRDKLAEAITQVKDAEAARDVPALIEALDHEAAPSNKPDYERDLIRSIAMRALAAIGDKRAVEPMIRLLEHPKSRLRAVTALGRLGDPRAIPPLLQILGDGADFARSVHGFPGWLSWARHPSRPLEDAETTTRGKALTSLASLGAQEILPTVELLLNHRDRFVRRWAAKLRTTLDAKQPPG
jgi:HEAT repeat protein